MKNKLKIISLNVNGLNDSDKRSKVFHWLKSLHADIILLQDPRCAPHSISWWAQQWQFPSIWSYRNAILLNSATGTIQSNNLPSHSTLLLGHITLDNNSTTSTRLYLPPSKPTNPSSYYPYSTRKSPIFNTSPWRRCQYYLRPCTRSLPSPKLLHLKPMASFTGKTPALEFRRSPSAPYFTPWPILALVISK